MTTYAGPLGKAFDITIGALPQDFCGSGITGKPVSMQNCEGMLVVVVKKKSGGTTDDLAIDLQEVNGAGGTPRDLDIITDYWIKQETDLDNDEPWVKVTQSAASEITAIAGTSETDIILAFAVRSQDLSDGYSHIAVNVPDLGNTDTEYGTVLYIPYGLKVQRAPVNMPSWKTPGTANA
jgi:hypothetical protein